MSIGIAQGCHWFVFRSAASIWSAVFILALGAQASQGAETAAQAGASPQGADLVRAYCSGCHHESAGQFERISAIRKTPEGWAMTLFRMRQVHGLTLEDGVRESLVRFLADTQGLAPAEAAAGRFALEQRPNAKDLDAGAEINVMCGRCHSLARVSLQRRDEEEWRKLSNTHVGQWPSIEYSASGRDRPWFQIASGPLPAKLAALYPYSSTAWTAWQKHVPADLAGAWVIVGHVPGGKDLYGTAHIERAAGGDWQASYALTDIDGVALSGGSKAIVYTGFEWRGSAELGTRTVREVYAVSEDGNRIQGRWFDADHAEEGGDWVAVREDGAARILAVWPRAQHTGAASEVTIVGMGFDPKPAAGSKTALVSFGDGVLVSKVQRDAHTIHARIKVAANATPGARLVMAGGVGVGVGVGAGTGAAGGGGAETVKFAVYAQIDQVDVVPGYAIARVGGGRLAPVSAQFEALASTRLPGGELLPLGPVAAEWISAPFDAEAKRTEDQKFAGHFDKRGRFLPGGAGPNTAREYSGDNVGNLAVVAKAQDGDRAVEGHGHLIVTVQRWNTPPIY
ncbi:MAG TPA: quinohemoprotein amine dehydrogenase subunit alpha [Steroidobacteraceae bacterium]|nr:quinohemoprotein amine dehydrogenase subunit alpha [Steroidobacteraceae bacterium]